MSFTLTRRAFVNGISAAGLAHMLGALGGCRPTSVRRQLGLNREFEIIDVHAHLVWTEIIMHERNRFMMEHHSDALGAGPRDRMVERLISHMDAAGVSRACLMGPSVNEKLAMTNEIVAEVAAEHPRRFIPWMGFDPLTQDAEFIRTEMKRLVERFGARGVGEFGGLDYADPRCRVVYQTASDLEIPVLFHTGVPLPSMSLRTGRPDPLDDIAREFPKLNIIAAHAGGPWLLELLAIIARHENVYVDLSMVPKTQPGAMNVVMAALLSKQLANRALFGTDYPVNTQAAWLEAFRDAAPGALLKTVGKVPALTAADTRKILGDNARRLMKL